MPEENIRRKRRLSSFQIIILGFAGVILLGALLLMLPISTTAGCVTPFNETLFTATSAVCVTGLVVQDTGSYWSAFGQAVILTLIQIGGLGVVTVAASFAMLSGRKISLMQRSTMKDAISAPKVGGIVRLTRFILRGTFLIELLGALAMLPAFCRDYGWRGVWMAVFHSISAFCNAGFDILGTENNLYPSLTGYAGSPGINITIMLLIVIGVIGFLTRDDVCEAEYIEMIRLKTSVLLACAMKMGAIQAGASAADQDALYRYGESLGLAFQLQDDYLDVYGDPSVFGKNIGGDITSNKKTFMLINALLRAEGQDKAELEAWIARKDFDRQEKVEAVTRLYTKLGIDRLARERDRKSVV